MGVFYLYADESGKLKQSPYTSFCGFVASDLEWWRFAQEWESCQISFGVPALHMSYIQYPDRDKSGRWAEIRRKWGNGWEARKQDMFKAFARVIYGSNLVCAGATIDSDYFLKMTDPRVRERMRDPLYMAFYSLVRSAIEKIDCAGKRHFLSVVIDDDREQSENYYSVLSSMRKNFPKEIDERISEIGFANDVAYPGIQAADLIAYESRDLMIKRKNDPTVAISELYGVLTKGGLHQPMLYGSKDLDKLCELYDEEEK